MAVVTSNEIFALKNIYVPYFYFKWSLKCPVSDINHSVNVLTYLVDYFNILIY